MSVDYVRGLFEGMGYSPASITLEATPNGAGNNIYVTKVGSTYPNVYIEFSAHLDAVSPGGSDNASGSTAVIELARVLKDYLNRYPMRFILWSAEEYDAARGAYYGSNSMSNKPWRVANKSRLDWSWIILGGQTQMIQLAIRM